MPGPEVDVIARAPTQLAPMTMPTAAISSSAWTMAKVALLEKAFGLSAAEHSAQLTGAPDDSAFNKVEEYELRFQDVPLDNLPPISDGPGPDEIKFVGETLIIPEGRPPFAPTADALPRAHSP